MYIQIKSNIILFVLKIELKSQFDFLVLMYFCYIFIVAYCLMQAKWVSILWCRINRNMFCVNLFVERLFLTSFSVELNAVAYWSESLLWWKAETSFPLHLSCFMLSHSFVCLFDKAFGYHIAKIWINFRPKWNPPFCGEGSAFVETKPYIDFPKTLQIKTIFHDFL